MSTIKDLGYVAFDDFNTSGVPASLPKKPIKSEIRAFIDAVDFGVSQAVSGGTNDRGTFVPAASSGTMGYPTAGGSGDGGAIKKSDSYVASQAGYIRTQAISGGDIVYANVDSPGQTAANWNYIDRGYAYTPEDAANRLTNPQDMPDDDHYLSEKATVDLVRTSFEVALKDQIPADPVMIGGRLVQPLRLTFDLWVAEGIYLDDSTTYPGGASLEDIVTDISQRVEDVISLEPVLIGTRFVQPLRLTFDLWVAEGYYIDNGAPYPPTAGSGSAFAAQVVDVDSDAYTVTIYRQMGGVNSAVYTMHVVAAYVDVPTRSDVWHTTGVYEAAYDGSDFTQGQRICRSGELETAVQLRTADNSTTQPDHMGGAEHGNQVKGSILALVRCAEIDLGVTARYITDDFQMFMPSTLYSPGDGGSPVYNGSAAFTMTTHWWFRPFEGVRIREYFVVQSAANGHEVENLYVGMVPIERYYNGNGIAITHTSIRSPLWVIEDVSTGQDIGGSGGFTQVQTTSDRIKIWGDRYSADVSMPVGWNAASRNVRVSSRYQYNKIYPDFIGRGTAANGTVMVTGATYEFETLINLGIKV